MCVCFYSMCTIEYHLLNCLNRILEDKDTDSAQMEIVIDKDVFIATVSPFLHSYPLLVTVLFQVEAMSLADKQVYLQQITAKFRQVLIGQVLHCWSIGKLFIVGLRAHD